MAIEIVVPRLGWSMDEGAFGGWLKEEGEHVAEGEMLFELESDKATQEVESFDAGVLRLPLDAPQSGDTVRVGQCLGFLCEADEPAPASCTATYSDEHTAQPKPTGEEIFADVHATPSARRLARELGVDIRHSKPSQSLNAITQEDVRASTESTNGSGSEPRATSVAVSPRAAAKAAQLGINLASVTGSGRGGRIRERDVLAAAGAAHQEVSLPSSNRMRTATDPLKIDVEAIDSRANYSPKSGIRQTIAERMLAATHHTAPVTLMAKADAAELTRLRRELKEACHSVEKTAPSMTSLLVKLVAQAIQIHPSIQHQWAEDGLLVPEGIHISVAVQTDMGLLTPVVRDVPQLLLGNLSASLTSLIERAKSGVLNRDEMQGGTFTVTNLGRYAVDSFTPILNLPQSAILGVGQIQPEPVAMDGEVVVRDQVSLSLTFDHRVHDGAYAAAFLQTLCGFIRNPKPWLLL
ncbi:MAG: dihydrolipoamide acetyltransferase family protein [Planctomycetota bacterium]